MHREERTIAILLRIDSVFQLTAVLAVFMPPTWMNGIHEWLGMGQLPEARIVGYLARSLS